MNWYHHNPTQPTEPGRTAIIGRITVNTYRSLITVCLALSGTNFMMHLHFSHSIEYRFPSVESKRRQDFYHLLLPVMLAFHNHSLLKNKTHPTSCPTIFKNRVLFFHLNTIFLTTIMITSCYVLRCSPWLNFPYGQSLPPLQ